MLLVFLKAGAWSLVQAVSLISEVLFTRKHTLYLHVLSPHDVLPQYFWLFGGRRFMVFLLCTITLKDTQVELPFKTPGFYGKGESSLFMPFTLKLIRGKVVWSRQLCHASARVSGVSLSFCSFLLKKEHKL